MGTWRSYYFELTDLEEGVEYDMVLVQNHDAFYIDSDIVGLKPLSSSQYGVTQQKTVMSNGPISIPVNIGNHTTKKYLISKKLLSDTLKKIDIVKDDVLAGLEVDASALASTLSTDLTSLTTELRDFVPELPALPDINLQSQLSSLSGLDVGSSQYNNLLGSITDNFGTALTSAGSSLGSLVSDAASAVAGGNTLSGIVPNIF